MALLAFAATDGPQPAIVFTPKQGVKFAAAIALFGAAMHYLVSGRKEANLGRMITGVVLALACLLCMF